MINLLRGQMFQSEIGLEQGGASPLSRLLGTYAPMPGSASASLQLPVESPAF